MCNCQDFNPIRRDSIDNYVWETLHQTATCPEQVGCPAFRRTLDCTSSDLEFFLKRLGGILASLGIPIV
jgi:hypothetical protein